MVQINTRRDKISAMLLLLLFLLPIITPLTHAFSNHEHLVCSDVTTHIHKLEKDCSICDFHITPFTYTSLKEVAEALDVNFKQFTSSYTFGFHSKSLFSRRQRGPPALS